MMRISQMLEVPGLIDDHQARGALSSKIEELNPETGNAPCGVGSILPILNGAECLEVAVKTKRKE